MIYSEIIKSTIGILKIDASDNGIRAIRLLGSHCDDEANTPNHHTNQAAQELVKYFNKETTRFSVKLDWEGYSEFYKSVWTYLISIPYGQTKTYGEIAKSLNNSGASRAVGLANAKNPIPVIVPCHRVIGSNGSLTGFALGLQVKQTLLSLENPDSFALQGQLF